MSAPQRAVVVAAEAILEQSRRELGRALELEESFVYRLAQHAVDAVLDDDLATDAIADRIEHARREHAMEVARSAAELAAEVPRWTYCAISVGAAHNDDIRYPCGNRATVEAFTINGRWEPMCERHAIDQGYAENDRIRPMDAPR